MIANVIGTEIKSGTFSDLKSGREISFNNIFVYCVKDNNYQSSGSVGFGSTPITVKIKNNPSVVSSVFGSSLTADDLEALVGEKVNLFYNEKGVIDSIVPVTVQAVK